MLRYMYITNDPNLARIIYHEGVERIFVDWEINGKQERQGHLDTVISKHTYEDALLVRQAVPQAELIIRLNPFYEGTENEVEKAIEAGADLLMIPMFYTLAEIRELCAMVRGRAGVVPLFETPESMSLVKDVCSLDGVYEVYVGLNDLHLSLGMHFMFEPLINGMLDDFATTAKESGVRFGFGGIARANEGDVSGKMVLGEHLRLGSKSVILSRTFYRPSEESVDAALVFKRELKILRDYEGVLADRTEQEIIHDARVFSQAVEKVAAIKRAKFPC